MTETLANKKARLIRMMESSVVGLNNKMIVNNLGKEIYLDCREILVYSNLNFVFVKA